MNQTEPAAIENAEAIIERFGGIRPMATKINVPVTTVQGWKKRNVIPGTRRAEILQAAQQLGVDLSDILSAASVATGKIANENAPASTSASASSFSKMVEQTPRASVPLSSGAQAKPRAAEAAPIELNSTLEKELVRAQRQAVGMSTAINVLLVLLAVGSVVLMLVPQNERRLDALEGNVRGLQEKQSFLSSLIPDDLKSQIASIRAQFGHLETGFGSALGKAQKVSDDVLATNAGSVEQRVAKLEGHLNGMGVAMPTGLNDLVGRLQGLSESMAGQQQLTDTTTKLMAMLSGVPEGDQMAVDQTLQTAAQSDPQVAETFQGVPPQDLKAAAMLLGMTQFRSTLNRDNQPFANDLALLKKLVGPEDPELQASIDRLAPYAEQGVLTPGGLTQEFRGLAGDVVVASLQGEDVSIKDKAQARLGDMFQVEKNGEQISGTPTQNTLANTDKLLEQGNLEGAIAEMQTLDGPAAVAAQPWVSKAQATVLAHKMTNMLKGSIHKKGYYGSAAMPVARGLNLPGSSKIIQNDETGINILRPNTQTPDPYQ